MTFIVWDDLYETGIASIDEQHKHLVSLLNRMLEALNQKKGGEEISYVIGEMAKYSEYHFSTEEELMLKAEYPDVGEHQIFHHAFTSKVVDYQHKLAARDDNLTAEVTIYLTNWLNDHLSTIDQKYVPYMKKAGIT
ncbi:MAG: bacteriohemerythrin [Methanospirillum sp.]|nr:bacteriohemerythrin [Methanospirillum sp.]